MAMLTNDGKVTPFHGDHHPVSVVQGRKSRNLLNTFVYKNYANKQDGWYTSGQYLIDKVTKNTDGSLTLPSGYSGTMYVGLEALIPRGTYTASYVGDSGVISSYCQIGSQSDYSHPITATGKTTFTAQTDDFYVRMLVVVDAAAFAGKTVRFMLNEGSTALPYEPYGTVTDTIFKPTNLKKSGTSLTFEQSYNHTAEVEMAGKSEQVQLAGKNLFNAQTAWNYQAYANIGEDRYQMIMTNGDGRGWNTLLIEGVGSYLKAGTYTASVNLVSNIDGARPQMECKYGFGSNATTAFSKPLNIGLNTATFTIPSDCYVLIKVFDSLYSAQANWAVVEKPQIETGSTATPYEPYCGGIPSPNPDYPQPIESVDSMELVARGRNIADPSNILRGSYSSGVMIIPSWMGRTHISFPHTPSSLTNTALVIIHAKAGETYSAAYIGSSNNVGVAWSTFASEDDIGSSANRIDYIDAGRAPKSFTITVNRDCVLLIGMACAYYVGIIETFSLEDFVVVKGSDVDGYEPYHSTTRTIDLQGHQLRSLPDGTKDELRVKRDGSVELVQRVGKRVIDGNRDWRYYGNDTQWPPGNAKFLVSEVPSGYESYPTGGATPTFKAWRSNLFAKYADFSAVFDVGSAFVQYPTVLYVSVPSSYATTTDQLKARLNETPLEIYGKLSTPQTIALPSIDPLPTYWPTTVIYDQDGNDISAYVKVVDDPQTAALISVMAQL